MQGSFSYKSLESIYEELKHIFTEQDVTELDFTRCVRPDGSAYGTKGKCRKGVRKNKSPGTAPTPAAEQKAVAKEKPQPPVQKQSIQGKDKPVKALERKALMQEYRKLEKKRAALAKKGKKEEAAEVEKQISSVFDRLRAKSLLIEPKAKTEKKTSALGSPPKSTASKETKILLRSTIPLTKKSPWDDVETRKAWQERQDRYDRAQEEAMKKLSSKEILAVKDYTRESRDNPRSYTRLNECLRNSPCKDKGIVAHSKEMDAALKKLPGNDKGEEFYRGVQVNTEASYKLYQTLRTAKPGTKIKDPGYSSYSSDLQTASDFAEGSSGPSILFISRSKSLKPISMLAMDRGESEAVLLRGTTQTIRGVYDNQGQLVVELD